MDLPRAILRTLKPAAMPLAYLVFTLLVWWQLWTPIDGARLSWKYDERYEYWQDLIFQADTLAKGQLALWNPWDRGGFPLYGDPQPGMLYPPNWPLVLHGIVAGGVPYVSITIKIIAHWVFASVGMHLFLRRLKASEPACYVGGLLFGWTNPKLRYGGSTLNWSLAWIPWLLLACHWFAEKPSARRGVILGSTAAMILLAGAPAVLLYTLLIAVPYGLYALRGRLRQALGPILIAGLVALLWVLPLVASNLEQLPESVRERRDLAFITGSAFTPGHFLNFLVPGIGTENPYYGLLPLLAAIALVAARARGLALVFLGIAVAGAVLALGEHAGVTGAVASAVPPFGLFRHAHRYLYVTAFAMAVLAGLGVAYLLSEDDEAARRRLATRLTWIGGGVTFALGMAALISYVVTDRLVHPKNEALGHALLAAATATWLARAMLLSPAHQRRRYAWLAVVLIALDMWIANVDYVASRFSPPPRARHDALAHELGDLRREWRIYDYGHVDYRPGTRLEIRDFGGYEGDPLALTRWRAFLDAALRQPRLFGHANVRWILPDPKRQPRINPPAGWKTDRENVFEVPEVAPAVFYVPAPVAVESPAEGLRALAKLTPGQGAVVEGAVPAGPADAAPTAGTLVSLEPNRVVAEIETPGPGLVVVAEAWFPAWRATVDGAPAAVLPANVMFRGIPVEAAGRHRIELQLRPMRFWGLLPAYLVAMLLLALAANGRVWDRLRARLPLRTSRPPRSDPPTA